MKRKMLSLTAVFLAFALTGCGEIYPDKAADGADWDKNWTILGSTLGVEESNQDLTLQENPVVLTGTDTYYATWSMGDSVPYINEDGDDTDLYDAQLYVLLVNAGELKGAAKEAADKKEGAKDTTEDSLKEMSGEEAVTKRTLNEWIDHERDVYEITNEEEAVINGQPYTLLSYRTISDTNPYERGITAFTIYGDYCMTAELSCQAICKEDEYEVMKDFLSRCHYNAAQQ